MKNSSIIIAFLTVVLMASCSEDDTIDFELTDVNFFTTQSQQDVYNIEVGDYISFVDISQGGLSHEWNIDEKAVFMNNTFTEKDSVYDAFRDPNKGKMTTDKAAHILFETSGLSGVQLYNTFADSVTLIDPGTNDTLRSERVGNDWVIDTTFVVDVFDKLTPAFSISFDGQELVNVSAAEMPSLGDTATWATVELEEGDELVLTDLSTTGRPTGRTWTLDIGNDVSTNSEIQTQAYNIVGNYLAGSMTSRRSGDGIPSSTVTKLIPLKITVDFSTAPIVFDDNVGITESEDEIISIPLKAPIGTFTGKESNFTVQVINTDAGFDSQITVATARRSASNEQVIELVLADPIYNSDNITVTYDGLGEIKNEVGFRILSAFGPESVSSYFDPINYIGTTDDGLAWSGYEVEWTNHNPGQNGYDRRGGALNYWVGGGNQSYNSDGTLAWLRDASLVYPEDGNIASMKFEAVEGVTAKVLLQGAPNGLASNDPIPAGTYLISFYVFMDASNTMTTITKEVTSPFVAVDFDVSNIARSEWVKLSQVVTIPSTPDSRWDTWIDPAKNTGAATGLQKFHMDKQEWTLWEPRL